MDGKFINMELFFSYSMNKKQEYIIVFVLAAINVSSLLTKLRSTFMSLAFFFYCLYNLMCSFMEKIKNFINLF